MIRVRILQPAFLPGSGTQVHHLDERVLTIERFCQNQTLFALTNLSADKVTMTLPNIENGHALTDLMSGRRFIAETISMSPYEMLTLESGQYPTIS